MIDTEQIGGSSGPSDPGPTKPSDPIDPNPDKSEPLPLPPDQERQPPVREPSDPLPAGDPPTQEPLRVSSCG